MDNGNRGAGQRQGSPYALESLLVVGYGEMTGLPA